MKQTHRLEWTRKQLDVLKPDIENISAYVFRLDTTNLRVPEFSHLINSKKTITHALDNIRERVGGVQALYDFMAGSSSSSMDALQVYFQWYLFSMRGTKFVQDNVVNFQTQAHRSLLLSRKQQQQYRGAR